MNKNNNNNLYHKTREQRIHIKYQLKDYGED